MNTKKITIIILAVFVISAVTWKVYDYQMNKKNYSSGFNEKEIIILDNYYSLPDKNISEFKGQLLTNPENSKLLTKLGTAYLLKARESNDPEFYNLAEEVLNKAVSVEPDNYLAIAELGSVYQARFRFSDALNFAKKALAINPYSSYSFGVLADAQIGLGMYEEAEKSINRIKDTKSDLSYFSRLSKMFELKGNTQMAIDAMKSAVIAGSPVAENTAWCRLQLGNLFYDKGDVETAESIYAFLIKDFPDYAHGYAGEAKIKFKKKQYEEAIDLYKKALEKTSFTEYMISLGDVFSVKGDEDEADVQYRRARIEIDKFRGNGFDTDLEYALFYTVHDTDLNELLKKANETLSNGSMSIEAFHVLAWINYRLGNYDEAEKNIEQALRLGTKDPLMYFHTAKIYEKPGDTYKAKPFLDFALNINPFYDKLYKE